MRAVPGIFLILFAAVSLWGETTLKNVIEETLKSSLGLSMKKEDVQAQKAVRLSEEGKFDTNLKTSAGTEKTPTLNDQMGYRSSDLWQYNTVQNSVNISFDKMIEEGLLLKVGYDISSNRYNGVNPSSMSTYYDGRANQSSVFAEIVIPLLKNSGRFANMYKVYSEKKVIEAKEAVVQYAANSIAFRVSKLYWDIKLARSIKKAFLEESDEYKKMIADIQKLADGGIVASSNIIMPQAQLYGIDSKIRTTNQNIEKSVNELLQIAHTQKFEMLKSDAKLEPFKKLEMNVMLHLESSLSKIQSNIKNRGDLRSMQALLASHKILYKGLGQATLPSLNLKVKGSYDTIKSGEAFSDFYDSLYDPKHEGGGYYAGVEFSVPLENRAAEGSLLEQKAMVSKMGMEYEKTRFNANSTIASVINRLRSALEKATFLTRAHEHYQKFYHDERIRFNHGEISIVDLIQSKEKLMDAKISILEAQAEISTLYTELFYQTGLLVKKDLSLSNLEYKELL